MPSVAQHQPGAALQARVDALIAESLAPVPRASRVAAVDVDHLALVTGYVAETVAAARAGHRAPFMSADTAVAWQRLEAAVRGCARTAA